MSRLYIISLLLASLETAAPWARAAAPDQAESVLASLRNDAALHDVAFVDGSNGWAVGDRGVIWHTIDGGSHWRLQSSGVACPLNSVFFIDKQLGWAVGGETRSLSTRGIVLRTADGGATWSAVPGLVLPSLRRVKFFDANVGVALGEGSSPQPSGVFITRDGGQTWQALPADQHGRWLAGDFLDADSGAVAGPAGRFATIARRQVVHSPLASPSLRAFRAMRLVPPVGGWLVGDGGLVMTTNDLGHSWQTPAGDLPTGLDDHFDFHAVAVHGQDVWIAGTPGTRLLHSPDGGQNWQALPTGQFAPIRGLSFIDAQHGWAVGELGTVLATRDGGRTWQTQRAGGRRAALLALFADAADVPLELIAEQGAAEGYVTAVDILHAEAADEGTLGQPAAGSRSREALLLAGAAAAESAWRFPLPAEDLALTPADVLTALNRANDGRAMQRLENHLVRTLRMWRPDVVVTRSAPTSGEGRATASPQTSQSPGPAPNLDPGHHDELLEQLVLRSVEAAGDPNQFVELAAEAGLEPWQVKKVYGVLPAGSHGDEAIFTSQFSAWLGASLADWSAPARRLLFARHESPPAAHELTLLLGSPEIAEARGIFGGIPLARGSEARRPAAEMPADDLQELRRLATRRRHLQELLERTEGNLAWAGQVAALTEDLDAAGGGRLLFQLAAGYRQAGRLDLAADTYYLLARRYPEHPLVDDALLWLVQFYSSGEAAHRSGAVVRSSVREDIRAARTEVRAAEGGQTEVHATEAGRTEVHATAFDAPVLAEPAVSLSRDERLRRTVQLVEYLRTARPMLYAEPVVRFAEVAAQRKLGYPNEAKRYFLTLGQLPERDPWRRCAETQQWLSQPGDMPPPKALAACRRADARPHLDGQLNEPFWEAADRMRLRGDAAAEHAEIRLAYDNAFLYLAVRCPKAAGGDYRPDDGPRPRDAELLPHDRVAVRLDVDRDFATAFELTVDHRGWTHDACWGDVNWNPSWYVAADSDETTWTVEAAVPVAELTADAPAARHVWAVSVRRTIPRVGYESWAGDATAGDSPDHFGLLIFE